MDLTDMISGGTEEQPIPEQKLTKEEYAAKKQQDEMQKNIDEQVKKIENADIFEILNMIPDEQRADVIRSEEHTSELQSHA